MRRPGLPLLVVTVAVAAAGACGKASDGASAVAGFADAAPRPDDPGARARAALTEAWLDAGGFAGDAPAAFSPVELLDPGAEPRRVLALAPRTGERRQRRLSLTFTQETKLSGAMMGKSGPSTISLAVTTRAPDPGAPWSVELGRLEITDSPEAGILGMMLAGWKPVAARLEVDAQGRRRPDRRALAAYRDVGSNEIARLLEDVLDAWLPELPLEAVGAGARWRVSERVVRNGIGLARVAEYTLEAGVPPRLRVRVELEAEPQMASMIGSAGILSTGETRVSAGRVEKWHAVLEASYPLDAGALWPDAAELAGVLDFEIVDDSSVTGASAEEQAEEEKLSSHIDLKARLLP